MEEECDTKRNGVRGVKVVEIEQEIDRGGGDALYSSTPNFVYDERETEDEFKTDFSSIKKRKENFRFLTISFFFSLF